MIRNTMLPLSRRPEGNMASAYEYPDELVAALEWIWGEGFLSPGGAEEVAAVLEGTAVRGETVLDIGSGLGAIDVLLATTHGAGRVVGIDVEPALVDRGRETAARAGVADRVEFVLVEPGPLPFADASFDVVFSKDAIIHVTDKAGLYREVLRVLRPGGTFVGSDWLGGDAPEPSEVMREWLEVVHLSFALATAAQCAAALEAAGFVAVHTRDRNAWYAGEVAKEVAAVSGPAQARLAARIGAEAAAERLRSCTLKLEVVRRGELRPTHFRARKPDGQ